MQCACKAVIERYCIGVDRDRRVPAETRVRKRGETKMTNQATITAANSNKNEENTMNSNDKKLAAFVQSAHDYYMEHTAKTFEELRDYQRSDWGDGLVGDEWASVDDAAEAGIDAAQQYIESESLTADNA